MCSSTNSSLSVEIPFGGESEQKTKGRRKRRALVGLGGTDVTRSAANQAGKMTKFEVGKKTI